MELGTDAYIPKTVAAHNIFFPFNAKDLWDIMEQVEEPLQLW